MRILLQFPEGLKPKALSYAREREASGDEVIISASPCFGACDLAIDEARSVSADKLVHFGHAEFQSADFDVEYVDCASDAPLGVLKDSVGPLSGFAAICLMTTIQHVHQLPEIARFYEAEGRKVVLNAPTGRTRVPGQVLGCDAGNVSAIDGSVDAFVYFGGGNFHPLGALMQTTKPFFVVDPFLNRVERIDGLRDVYHKRSKGRVVASLGAKNFGILVSTKSGQFRMDLARSLKKRIEVAGLSAAILVSNAFDFESLGNLSEVDAFVSTACPRIATDDGERLRKPLLNPDELIISLEMREK